MSRSQQEKITLRAAFAERLKECLKQTGRSVSPSDLVREFNAHFDGPPVHAHSCRKWLLGEAVPTQEKLVVLAQMCGVSPDWLRYGDATRALEMRSATPFTRQELALVSGFQRLGSRDRKVVQQLMGVLLKLN
jgi:hypothetical protein